MCLFHFLKKKKAKPLTPEERLNRIWELWEMGDLQSPIANLMTYESEVNNGGHSQYFFNVANNGNLVTEVETTLFLLPEPLHENLYCAYTAFLAQGDISDDTNEELFDKCDDIFYEHEQLIIDIIQETANNGFEYKNNT